MGDYKYFRRSLSHNGRRYEVRGRTKAECEKKYAELLLQLDAGMDVASGERTCDGWFCFWMEVYKAPTGITDKSLGMYPEKWYGYISPAIGRMKLKDVREGHLQAILNSQAGGSFSHVSKLRIVLRAVFSRAHSARLIPFNPAAGLTLPATTKGQRRALTDEERAAVLSVAQTHRAGPWVLTMLYTGMRPGETAALTWADVDFTSGVIHVSKAAESGTERVKGPKTAAGVRDLPMRSELRAVLWAARGLPLAPVFTTATGKKMTASAMRVLWESFLRDVDLQLGAETYRNQIVSHAIEPGLTTYCLRHTFCTDLQRAGVPINVAKELMGHADISTTANIYTHKDGDTARKAVEMVEKFQKKEA